MDRLFLLGLRLLLSLFRSRRALLLENLALRQQLSTLVQLDHRRPRIHDRDRQLWAWLAEHWPDWKQHLLFVKPDTVIRWHRAGFRSWWRWRSRPRGRPSTKAELRQLIRRMATDNPLWGAPRIHGELLKLGFSISERTVSRLMPRRPRKPGDSAQRWLTFLKNHAAGLVSVDFFTVPTASFRVLHAFVVLHHERRRVLHLNVTEHPTDDWLRQQLLDAFFDRDMPQRLIRDRDRKFGKKFRGYLRNLDVQELLTAFESPWQNPFCERVIGTIRRDLLDHVIVLNERHLRSLLTEYSSYYHECRTHLALDKDCPEPSAVEPPEMGRVVSMPKLGGLHHRYCRRAA